MKIEMQTPKNFPLSLSLFLIFLNAFHCFIFLMAGQAISFAHMSKDWEQL
jgi:hypothetical protein